MTRLYAKVFPVFWFGVLGLFLIFVLISGEVRKAPFILLPFGIMGAMGFF
jgi:hypothetical protein